MREKYTRRFALLFPAGSHGRSIDGGDRRNIAELLALPGSENIELPIPDRREYPRKANLA
ncbi:MAG: hypothetical protein F4Z20_06895 [Gammaproteobacteria bacterium]|nr:hypothetical protein [Gammaproteobacteria bacterium]